MEGDGDARLVLRAGDEDVVLRELGDDDVDAYVSLVDRNRSHLNTHGDHPFEHAASVEDLRSSFLNRQDRNIRLGIWWSDRLVGRVDLNAVAPPAWVIGYWLDAAATGRGIATTACAAAVDHARTIGATELYAAVTVGNQASERVLRRLGFEHIQDVERRTRWRLPLVPDPPPPVMVDGG